MVNRKEYKGMNVEVKKGDRSINIPGWVGAALIVTLGAMVTDICKVAISNHK